MSCENWPFYIRRLAVRRQTSSLCLCLPSLTQSTSTSHRGSVILYPVLPLSTPTHTRWSAGFPSSPTLLYVSPASPSLP
ncbi:hypothetical protein E2C01_083987 [Portunus trituberculatus]|uniref:Uncharacterized protein n=1 Tax=Portunus trituberculatus TaxID=210409 RepID=A0A5B7J326_PORTR|nr:hypothetical protein [Portunus trituberculatus]